MAQMPVSHNPSQNPDPQKDGTSGDDITYLQEHPTLPDRPPKSLIEWLARTIAPAAHLPWHASARECRCQSALPGVQPGENQRHQLIY